MRPTAVPASAPTPALSPLTVAAVVVTVLAWASAFVGDPGGGAGPLAGRPGAGPAAGRHRSCSASCSCRAAGSGRRRGSGRLLGVCGVGWFGVYNLALNAAEQHLDAGTTAMLVNIGPILIAVFAGLLLGEGFPRWLVVGLAVAFVRGAAHRGGHAQRGRRPGGRRALRRRRGHLRRRRGGAEAAAAPAARAAGDLHRVRDGRRLLPAVGRRAGRRARPRPGVARSPAWSTSARCRPRSLSAPGPTRSAGWTPAGWGHHLPRAADGDRCWAGCCSTRCRRRSRVVGGAVCLAGVALSRGAPGPPAGARCRRRPAPPPDRHRTRPAG